MFQKKIPKDYVKYYVEKRYSELPIDTIKFEKVISKNKLNLKNKIILDLAAGPGTFEIIMSKFNPKQIFYLDLGKDYLNFAKKKHKKLINNTKIIYINDDLMGVNKFKSNSIDFIFCNISLFYINNEKLFFSHIQRILNKNGHFFFVTPSFNYMKKKSFSTKVFSYMIYFLNFIVNKKVFPTPMQNYNSLKNLWKKNKLKEIYFDEDKEGLMYIVLKNE